MVLEYNYYNIVIIIAWVDGIIPITIHDWPSISVTFVIEEGSWRRIISITKRVPTVLSQFRYLPDSAEYTKR